MTDYKERIDLGDEASKLWDNPILQFALKKVKTNAISELTVSNHDESDLREHIYIKLKVLEEFERSIKALIRDGAASKLKMERTTVRTLKSLD